MNDSEEKAVSCPSCNGELSVNTKDLLDSIKGKKIGEVQILFCFWCDEQWIVQEQKGYGQGSSQ